MILLSNLSFPSIFELVSNYGGKAVLSSETHNTGTDRVFEVFKNTLNSLPNIIVNLQGDMPNIEPKIIKNLINYMQQGKCEVGTLASEIKNNSEHKNR